MRARGFYNVMIWEYFRDVSYYDLWAVRPVGERRWGCCYHLNSKDEAEGLTKLLTDNKVSSPFDAETH